MSPPDNPYAAPRYQPPPSSESPPVEPKPLPKIGHSLLKWTLACGIAAGPSFFLALGLVHPSGHPAAAAGMTAGVVTFIALYVFAERTQTVQRMLSWQFARRTTWIGYGTRIAASIIFPVGMLVDSICGIFSVGVNRWFFGGFPSFHEHAEVTGGEHSIVFIQYLTTTVTQGLLLNIALTGYMLFVFGICHIFAALLGRKAGTFF